MGDQSQEKSLRRIGALTGDRTGRNRKAKGRGTTLGPELGDKGRHSAPAVCPPSILGAEPCKLIQTELFGNGKSSFFLRPELDSV